MIELGSISTGTLRGEDLAPAFLGTLERVAPDGIGSHEHSALVADVARVIGGEDVEDVLDRITDAIGANLPAGLRFGAHEGDGADFGIWEVDGDE